jgi:plasmid replication initiation protein
MTRKSDTAIAVIAEGEVVLDEKGGQLDLVFDSPLIGKVKNDRALMVWSFFALDRKKVDRMTYDDSRTRIVVTGLQYGVANMWDKEILIYLISIMQDKLNRGEAIGPTMTFTAADLFRVIGREAGGSAYDRLEESLKRLRNTSIETNIETGGEGESGGFSWLSEYKLRYRRNTAGEKVLRAVEVTICNWLYRAVTQDKKILTYHAKYFELGPLEKRLYEMARAHCGQQAGIRMNLEKLRLRVGFTDELKQFKWKLGQINKKKAPLPEYGFVIVDPRDPKRLGVALDPALPKPRGRTPLKAYQVFFFRTDNLAKMPTPFQVPDVDVEGADLFPDSEMSLLQNS